MQLIASSATFLPNCDLGLARHLEPSHPNGGVVFHDSSPCPFALNQSQQAQVAADNSEGHVLFVVACLLVAEEVAKHPSIEKFAIPEIRTNKMFFPKERFPKLSALHI